MRLSEDQKRRARESSARVTRQRKGTAFVGDALRTEARFRERRKRDASYALMLGMSARFICHDIPAYVRGERLT